MRVSVSDPRRVAYVVAAAYVAAHAWYIAPSLEDIDSINFALGLRDFDPARHQPHPPGSPVYIALGRALLMLVSIIRPALDQITAEALTLGIWSLVAGVVAVVASAELFALLAPQRPLAAIWSVVLLAASPLFWLSGLRPMSDLPGLAAALVAQVLILQGRKDRQRLVYGALASGVAIGIRLQKRLADRSAPRAVLGGAACLGCALVADAPGRGVCGWRSGVGRAARCR